ncbi:hypothetical protein LCI01_13310 [Leuconostoc citreum]|nr:hypothetical protein LCI01_13310 [Leuconostoc citreum]
MDMAETGLMFNLCCHRSIITRFKAERIAYWYNDTYEKTSKKVVNKFLAECDFTA